MVGIRLMIIMAIVGGFIAYLADHLGSKIGKKKMSVFGLRPKHTALLLTVLSGVLISLVSIGVVSVTSESARTALFGMEKIQAELKVLNSERDTATKALEAAKANVEKQNTKISELDIAIKSATDAKAKMESQLAGVNEKYISAQSEVKSLSEAKESLSKEVGELEAATNRLRQGLINMREGQLYYRAGEVVYGAVLKGGMDEKINKDQLMWLLQNGNEAALQRLGSNKPEKPVQVLWISQDLVDEALRILNTSKGDYVCRLRTIANIMVGELVVCELEMAPNKLIYSSGTTVHSANFASNEGKSADALLIGFLGEVNHTAVAAGVLPDPVSGKVGNIDAESMVIATNAIKDCTGPFTLVAYARQDVYTAGPVTVGIRIKSEKVNASKYER